MHSKTFLFFTTLFLIAAAVSAQTVIPGGNVSGSWTSAGSPYVVEGDITLNSGETLDIEPAVKVFFTGHYRFFVEGILNATGTEMDSITFTSLGPVGGWSGLRFYDLNTQPDSSRLAYCSLTNGVSSDDMASTDNRHGGAIFCFNSSKLVIQNCLFMNNQTAEITGADGANGSGGVGMYGNSGEDGEDASSGLGGAIYLSGSDVQILDCTFMSNRTGNAAGGNGGDGAVRYMFDLSMGGDGGLGGSAESGSGGAICVLQSSPVISGNEFIDNYTGDAIGGNGGDGGEGQSENNSGFGGDGGNGGNGIAGCGGEIHLNTSNATIVNNIFRENLTGFGSGGDGGQGGDGVCFMATQWSYGGDGGDGGSGYGGHGSCLSLSDSSPSLNKITITDGDNGLGYAGGNGDGGGGTFAGNTGLGGLVEDGDGVINSDPISLTDITNSIVYDNSNSLIIGTYNISYSCIEGGYGGTGNISSDPAFLCPEECDYRMQWESPCIDTGNPDPLYNDPDGTVADMGFYHYDQSMPVNVFLTPHDAPIQVPASGGDFDFTIWLNNTDVSPHFTEIWCDLRNIDGIVLATVVGPIEITVGPTLMLNRIRMQTIPAGLMMGTYSFNAFVVADTDTSHDSFTFFKHQDDELDDLFGWMNTGEAFGTGKDEACISSTEFTLRGAYPNPFNPTTVVSYQLPTNCFVNLTVYDVSGREVATLVDGYRDVGTHEVVFDGSNLASGVYLTRLTANGRTLSSKMMLIK